MLPEPETVLSLVTRFYGPVEVALGVHLSRLIETCEYDQARTLLETNADPTGERATIISDGMIMPSFHQGIYPLYVEGGEHLLRLNSINEKFQDMFPDHDSV